MVKWVLAEMLAELLATKIWIIVFKDLQKGFLQSSSLTLLIYVNVNLQPFICSLCFQVTLYIHFTSQPNMNICLLFPLDLPAETYSLNNSLIFKVSVLFSACLFPFVKKCTLAPENYIIFLANVTPINSIKKRKRNMPLQEALFFC